MTTLKALEERHSVRNYLDQPIPEDMRYLLDSLVEECNEESGLRIRICYDDPEGFDSRLAHYGKFRNVRNYIILAGYKGDDIEEKCGYYGEKIVIKAQQFGLNTCWVALTFNKNMVKKRINPQEKLCMVIALGYGADQGQAHKSKPLDQLLATRGTMPDWFRKGAEAAMLAPTAMNQQKFVMGMRNGEPAIRIKGAGPYTKVDLGIVRYHFELASGRKTY